MNKEELTKRIKKLSEKINKIEAERNQDILEYLNSIGIKKGTVFEVTSGWGTETCVLGEGVDYYTLTKTGKRNYNKNIHQVSLYDINNYKIEPKKTINRRRI